MLSFKERGLHGVEFVVSDDHAGLRRSLMEILPEAAWQRCYVHFLRNALDHMPRKADDDCLQELRWLYDRRNLAEAQKDLSAWIARWQSAYPPALRLGGGEHRRDAHLLPSAHGHHKHLKSTNMLERLNEEIKRRTNVVRIFPNKPAACGWSEAWPSRPTRAGSRNTATSTWICSSNTSASSYGNFRRPPRKTMPGKTSSYHGQLLHSLTDTNTQSFRVNRMQESGGRKVPSIITVVYATGWPHRG